MKTILNKKTFLLLFFFTLGLVIILYLLKNVFFGTGDYEFHRIKNNDIFSVSEQELNRKLEQLEENDFKPDDLIPLLDSIDQSNMQLMDKLINRIVSNSEDNGFISAISITDYLTQKNQKRNIRGLTTSSLDTLFNNYQWATAIKSMSFISEGIKSTIYSAVYDYWMLDIVHQLQRINEEKGSIKYSLKFRTMSNLCNYHSYSPNFSTSDYEKVLYNIQESRYSYIINRFYLAFGIPGFIILAIFLLFTSFSYIFVFQNFKIK